MLVSELVPRSTKLTRKFKLLCLFAELLGNLLSKNMQQVFVVFDVLATC